MFKACNAKKLDWGGNSSALGGKNIAVESTDKCTNIELFL